MLNAPMPPPPVPVPPPRVSARERLRASVRQSRQTLGLVWRSAPGGTLVLAGLTLVAATLPPLVAYVGKLIVDAVMARASERAVRLVLVELGAVAAIALVERALGL